MEGMREIARSYYERATEYEKKSIKDFFTKLDVNGDGKISISEFKKSVSSWLSAEAVFEKLDTNGDGSLDFDEFLCLHYMEKKVMILKCDGCRDLLVDPYFSCLLCFGRGNNTFDLCCSCYRHNGLRHEHSSDYMLDHHSLLKVFRDRTAAAEKSENKKKMEELQEIAKTYYRDGSSQVQHLAHKFYQTMDSDGDGRVDLSEFLDFMRQEGYFCMRTHYFFNELDLDGNGTLDFYEVMTLYYIMKSGRPFCDGCGHFIPGIFFSCVECFKSPRSSFDLCGECYRNAKYSHNHEGRSHFLDNYTLLQATRDPALAQTSGMQALNLPRNSIVPILPHPHETNYMYIHNSYPVTYNNTYMLHYPIPSNAIVPATYTSTNWNKWRDALTAFEAALSIVNISSTLCTIL